MVSPFFESFQTVFGEATSARSRPTKRAVDESVSPEGSPPNTRSLLSDHRDEFPAGATQKGDADHSFGLPCRKAARCR